MTADITTSICVPSDVRDLYETLAQMTGRVMNDLMVEALRVEGQRQVDELAIILEGRAQAKAGQVSLLGDVVNRLKAKGLLPADFDLSQVDAD
jgi:predicted transcriptional regulator